MSTKLRGQGAFLVSAFLILVSLSYYLASQTREVNPRRMCLPNLKQLAVGTILYAEVNNDCLPPGAWMDPLHTVVPDWGDFSEPPNHFVPSTTRPTSSGYAVNWRVVGRTRATTASECVVFFESDSKNLDLVANVGSRSARHKGGSIVALSDSSAKWHPLGSPLREEP